MPSQKGSRGTRRRRLGRRVRPGATQDAAPSRGGRSSHGGRAESRRGAGTGAGRTRRNNQNHSSTDEREHHPDQTYKTEMCNNWIEFGQCRYNNKCRFAHGEQELRVARRINSDKNWKSELCRNYHSEGACTYGRRCHFIHEETPEELARMHATQKRVGGQKSQRRKTPRTDKQHPRAAPLTPVAVAEAREEQQLEAKVPVGSPSFSATSTPAAATLALASDVASLRLHHPVVQQLAHEEATTAAATSSSSSFSSPVTAPLVSSPMPISRKRSLQRFCHLVGLPVEETNPNEAAAAEPVSSVSPPSGESPPFLLRPQAAFGHMHGKVMYEPKTPFTPAIAPRTPPRMEYDSPAKRRVRLPVFTRIASDTGVATNPPSPLTTSP